MTINDDYPHQIQQIESGVITLKRRQRHLILLTLMSSTVAIVSLLSLLIQQDIVYSFFGISLNVQQLHLPFTVDENLQNDLNQSDYLFNLLSWFGWLLLKSVSAFLGAFLMMHILKKFQFFQVRLQSFLLKFAAWLLAFILIWVTLSFIQSDFNDEKNNKYQSFTQYEQSIQQSEIYQYLQQSNEADAIKSYLLTQTALLHQPIDQNVATAYASKLIQAERKDPHFLEYGFKPEQIWSIQHQIYGKAVTPMALNIEPRLLEAQKWEKITQMIIIILTMMAALVSLILYLLSTRLKARLIRISEQLKF